MTLIDYLNVAGRIVLTVGVIIKLGMFREMANAAERYGLGMMGAGSFLTIPIIIMKYSNPFEGWAVSLLTYGAILFLGGRTWRDSKHSRANAAMVRQGRDWQAQRGKP